MPHKCQVLKEHYDKSLWNMVSCALCLFTNKIESSTHQAPAALNSSLETSIPSYNEPILVHFDFNPIRSRADRRLIILHGRLGVFADGRLYWGSHGITAVSLSVKSFMACMGLLIQTSYWSFRKNKTDVILCDVWAATSLHQTRSRASNRHQSSQELFPPCWIPLWFSIF